MAQHDYVIDNSTGANVRADINNVLQAIATNNSGSSDPSTTVASQFFADTNAGIMKLRNTSNNGYVNLFTLAGGIDVDAASTFSEDVTFEGASANIFFDKSANTLDFLDGTFAAFGNARDLRIYHNGSNSYIQDQGTGNLHLTSNGTAVSIDKGTSENMAVFNTDGAVELYHDNSKKFQTYSAGIQFFGNIKNETDGTNQGLFLGAANDFQFYHDGNRSAVNNRTGDLRLLGAGNIVLGRADSNNTTSFDEQYISCNSNGAVELYYDNSKKFETTSAGTQVSGNLVCGSVTLSGGGLALADDDKVICGNGDDLKIGHDGSESFVFNDNSGVNLVLKTAASAVIKHDTETMAQFIGDGSAELYYDNSKKFETTNSGIAVSGKIGVGSTAANNSINVDGNAGNGQTTLFYGFGTIDLTSASDERVKNNVVDTAKGLDDILKLRIVDFTYTPEYAEDSTTVRTGGIAQEWQKVDPNLVNSENDDLLFIEYKRVIPHLIKAVQELSAKVAVLEAA